MEKQPLLEIPGRPVYNTVEPTLTDLQQDVIKAQRAYWRKWSRTTSGKYHRALMVLVSIFLILFMLLSFIVIVDDAWNDDEDVKPIIYKVPLEAHIMSKCPDARDCLRDMILPAMQNVSDKVDFRLSYIGQIVNDTSVSCKHGADECRGNVIELCAAKLYPDPKISLGFTWCLTREYQDIPKLSLVADCALEHGISMEKLGECAVTRDDHLKVNELQSSFQRSAAAGVSTSCTIRLAGRTRCVRDDGKWRECEGGSTAEDLVSDIEALYDHRTIT